MPRVTYQQTNFTAGELSRRVHGRTDVDRYQNAARELLNAYPVIHGGARRRDGLRYVAATKHSGASASRLVTFVYSRDDAYVLEFGELYVRIYKAGTSALIAEIASPYSASALGDLDFAQGADTMFIAHPTVPMQRLRRMSPTSWSLDAVPWIVEPFDEQGHTFATTLTLSAATVGTGRTATAGSSVFIESDVGRKIVSGTGVATVTGYTSGTVVTITVDVAFSGTSIASGAWKLDLSPYAFIRPWEATPVGSEINVFGGLTRAADVTLSAKTGTITVTATSAIFVAGDVGKRLLAGSGRAVVSVYTDSTHITCTTEEDFESTVYVTGAYGLTAPTWRAADVGKFLRLNGGLLQVTTIAAGEWAKARILSALDGDTTAPPLAWSLESPVWSATNGYPRTVTLHEQRLMAAGSPAYPQRIWGSRIGTYLDFTPGTADDDAFSFEIASDEVNPIGHLVSARTLVAHTYGGEFSLQGGVEKPITATNVRIRPESSHGSKGVRPVKIGRESVFVQRSGRKVRSMGYRYDFDGYSSPDLVVLAEHITSGGVVEMAYQQEPDTLLWAVRGDGALLSCTLDRDQGVTGWALHTTDGAFESVASVPAGERDETWVVVRRTVNATTVRYLEVFEQAYGQPDAAINRYQVDSGKAYQAPGGITALTGLSHLEGKSVDIVADGAALPRQTVSGGALTLPRSAVDVLVGLPYETRITTLTPEVGTGMGSAQGNNMRTSEVSLRLLDTIGGKVQAVGGQAQRIPFRNFGPDVLDAPPQPFSGIVRVETLGWDRGTSEVTVIQDQPLPMHVLSIIRKFTVND